MQIARRELNDLLSTWQNHSAVLARYGFNKQTRAFEACISNVDVEDTVERLWDAMSVKPLRTWADEAIGSWRREARILERYGHPDEAVVVSLCADDLSAVVTRIEEAMEESRSLEKESRLGSGRVDPEDRDLEARNEPADSVGAKG